MFFKRAKQTDMNVIEADKQADTAWSVYQHAIDGNDWAAPSPGHDLLADPTELSIALTQLYRDGYRCKAAALLAISRSDEASNALASVDSHHYGARFGFAVHKLNGFIDVRHSMVTSEVRCGDMHRLYYLNTDFTRKNLGDDPQHINYCMIVAHHIDLMLAAQVRIARELEDIRGRAA